MGIGHAAVGLGLKAADRRLNAGLLIFAAFFADFLLGWFTLAGWESYEYPENYASVHYMFFNFPWSHGLLPLMVWGACLGGLVWLFRREIRPAVIVGVAVVSHFLLDGLVHLRGLPVAGPGTWALGVGLWRNLRVALTIEAAMTAVALVIYVWVARDHSLARRFSMAAYMVLLGALAIVGQSFSSDPSSRTALIVNWITGPLIFAVVAWSIDYRKDQKAAMASGI